MQGSCENLHSSLLIFCMVLISSVISTQTKPSSTSASMQMIPYWLLDSFICAKHYAQWNACNFPFRNLHLPVWVFMNVCVSINLGWYLQRSCWEMQDGSIKQTWVSLGRQHRDITHTLPNLCVSSFHRLPSLFLLHRVFPAFLHTSFLSDVTASDCSFNALSFVPSLSPCLTLLIFFWSFFPSHMLFLP